MEKLNCDIIKDLIPSYVDDLCSEATKRCVEEHIESCGQCRQMLAAYQSHALSGEKLEQRQLDGLQKIWKTMKAQTLLSYLILVFLIYCGIQIFITNHINYPVFSQPGLLLVICILANILSDIGCKRKNPLEKLDYILGSLSFILDLYFIMIFLYFVTRLTPELQPIWGMEPMETGPFLEKQLIAAFIAQLAFFAYHLWGAIKREKNSSWLLSLNMTGIFLLIKCDLWLKRMDSYELLRRTITRDILEVIVIGAVGIAATLLFTGHLRKKRKDSPV